MPVPMPGSTTVTMMRLLAAIVILTPILLAGCASRSPHPDRMGMPAPPPPSPAQGNNAAQ